MQTNESTIKANPNNTRRATETNKTTRNSKEMSHNIENIGIKEEPTAEKPNNMKAVPEPAKEKKSEKQEGKNTSVVPASKGSNKNIPTEPHQEIDIDQKASNSRNAKHNVKTQEESKNSRPDSKENKRSSTKGIFMKLFKA